MRRSITHYTRTSSINHSTFSSHSNLRVFSLSTSFFTQTLLNSWNIRTNLEIWVTRSTTSLLHKHLMKILNFLHKHVRLQQRNDMYFTKTSQVILHTSQSLITLYYVNVMNHAVCSSIRWNWWKIRHVWHASNVWQFTDIYSYCFEKDYQIGEII